MKNQSKKSKALFKEGIDSLSMDDIGTALEKLIKSLENKPSDIPIWIQIGFAQLRILKYQQAIETFEFVVQLEPNNMEALGYLALAYSSAGHLDQAMLVGERIYTDFHNSSIHLIYASILCSYKSDRKTRLEIYKSWGEKYANHLSHGQKINIDKQPLRKLRIGYVSGDMREHSVAYFMEPVFMNHDHNQIDVFVFATNHTKDQTTNRLNSLIPNWHDVSTLDDNSLLKLIRRNKIDILIDLSGHTSGNRLFVFAKRAAPIQLTWLGFMGTLGMNAIDYRLTDSGADPIGSEQWYVEKLFRLECMASYCPPPNSPLALDPPLSSQPSPTLVSLNASKKITDKMLLIWKRILEARPDANLILHVSDRSIDEAINAMLPRLEQLAMPLDQISISPQVPLTEFMERGLVADIALDTHPISGGTTTLHALWMGLPVIAMEAEDAMSSSTARILQGLGLSEWVANNEEEYIQIVLNLMDDKDRLKKHRAEIRDILASSVLMNYKTRCTELERSFCLMWFNYLLGESRYLHSDFDLAIETEYVKQRLCLDTGN